MEKLDENVQKQLNELLDLLKKDPVIVEYQRLENKVNHHEGLKKLQEDLEKAQKDAVNFTHYEKFTAAKLANEKADSLKEQLDTHPLVVAYRQALYDANELLQYVTELIETKVNIFLKGSDKDATKD